MKRLLTLSSLLVVSSSFLKRHHDAIQESDGLEQSPIALSEEEISKKQVKQPPTELTCRRFLVQGKRMFNHRTNFLSGNDIMVLLIERLCAADEDCVDLVDYLTEFSGATSREAAIDRFIASNMAEFQPLLRRLFTLDLKAFSVTTRPEDDSRLVYLKRVLQAYAPHCGDSLYSYLPSLDRKQYATMLPKLPDDKYTRVVSSGPGFDAVARNMRHHMRLLSAQKSLLDRLSCSGRLDEASPFEVTSMGGSGIYALRDRFWIIVDFERGGGCHMKDLNPSTYRLVSSMRSSLRVDGDRLLLARPLDKEYTEVVRGSGIKLLQVEKSNTPGNFRALFKHGNDTILFSTTDAGSHITKKMPANAKYTLDGDVLYVDNTLTRRSYRMPLVKGGVAAGVYPTTRMERDKRVFDYNLQRYHASKPSSYALAEGRRGRIVDAFRHFCHRNHERIAVAKPSKELEALSKICTSINDRSQSDEVWKLMEQLIVGKPYSKKSILWILIGIVDK